MRHVDELNDRINGDTILDNGAIVQVPFLVSKKFIGTKKYLLQ